MKQQSGLGALAPAERGDLALDVHAQVGGPGDALLVAQLAVCLPRLVIDADHTLRSSSRGHVSSVARVWASAVHRHDTNASRKAVVCMGTRDTLAMRSRAGPDAPTAPAQTSNDRKKY